MDSEERRWVAGWLEAGPVLEQERRDRLRALTPERAMFLADALFALPWPDEVMARRRITSGLLEMQDLLRALRPR